MATIDMTHRKLNFPPRFLPYLEKHRIFELFHECVELLVQVRPKDHITFLKNVLPCAAMKKNKQRIVFLSPVSFDRETFSELVADCLGIQKITEMYLEVLTREKNEAERIQIETISESVEEESCICPGEGEGKSPFPPLYYTSAEEGRFVFGPESATEEEEEEEMLPEEQPCICVCPCVKEREKEEQAHEFKEDEAKGREEVAVEEDYPCELTRNKKKKQKLKVEPFLFAQKSSTSESSSGLFDINYGLLAECETSAKGWILQDLPGTGEQAEKLNALGVIPTHALRIIIDEEEESKNQEYNAIVNSWMRAYKYVPVMEIRVRGRDMSKLVKDTCNLLSVMPHRHAPMLPRIVLIGSIGSGVTTQGRKLARKYGMVHVEFEVVIAQALQQEDELCKLYKTQLATRSDPELEAFILERALLTSACRNRGWVLTGYPRNIDQMRMLDIIATPPNRMIFVEVPARECFVRLYYRKIDPCLGDVYKMPKIEPFGLYSYETPDIDPETAARLLSHPKNNKKKIIHDIEKYFIDKKDMMMYSGKTASYVDGNQTVDRVFELIEQILINPAPAQPPRDPIAINYGIQESYERLKKFRLASGMFFNNLFLNPPERVMKF